MAHLVLLLLLIFLLLLLLLFLFILLLILIAVDVRRGLALLMCHKKGVRLKAAMNHKGSWCMGSENRLIGFILNETNPMIPRTLRIDTIFFCNFDLRSDHKIRSQIEKDVNTPNQWRIPLWEWSASSSCCRACFSWGLHVSAYRKPFFNQFLTYIATEFNKCDLYQQ